MGLYRRGSVWWMGFTHSGKQLRRSTETEDKKLAIRIFDKLKGEIAEGKWFESLEGEEITFHELMNKYMSDYSAISKARSSHERDKGLRKHLEPIFGDMLLTEIKACQIADYKVMRRQEGASPRTVNYELSLMGHAFNMALREWEWVRVNPVSKVRKERVRNTIERWLTFEEEAKLVAASPKWLQEIIVFAIQTGFRESEILGLTWKQVDLNRRTITIYEQKNGNIDTVPISRSALRVLRQRYEDRHGQSQWVFLSKCGTRLCREHPTRKHGVGRDRYFAIRYQRDGKRVEEGIGWASELDPKDKKHWTAEKAAIVLAGLREAARGLEKGPTRLSEKREIEDSLKEAEKVEQERLEKEAVTFRFSPTPTYPRRRMTKSQGP
jgi:integrase